MEHILLLKINKNELDNKRSQLNNEDFLFEFLNNNSQEIYDFGSHLDINFDSIEPDFSNYDNNYYKIDKDYLRSIIRLYQDEINDYFLKVFKNKDEDEMLKVIRDEILFWNNQDLSNHSFNFRFTNDKSKNIFRLIFILETFDFNNNYLILSQ